MAMQVPFVGFQPVKTSEHMAAAGVFGLLQVFICHHYISLFDCYLVFHILESCCASCCFSLLF